MLKLSKQMSKAQEEKKQIKIPHTMSKYEDAFAATDLEKVLVIRDLKNFQNKHDRN